MFARRHNAVLLALLFLALAVAGPLYAAPLPQLDFPLPGIVNRNANLRTRRCLTGWWTLTRPLAAQGNCAILV